MKKKVKSLWEKNRKALKDAFFEVGRLILLAIIPLLIDRFTAANIVPELGVGIVIFLRWVDKYLHEFGKENEDEFLTKGLTRF